MNCANRYPPTHCSLTNQNLLNYVNKFPYRADTPPDQYHTREIANDIHSYE